jgi:hypothetical protein
MLFQFLHLTEVVPWNYTFLTTEMELASVKVCQVGLRVAQTPDNAQCLLLLLCTNSNLLSDLSSSVASIRCSSRLYVFLSDFRRRTAE